MKDSTVACTKPRKGNSKTKQTVAPKVSYSAHAASHANADARSANCGSYSKVRKPKDDSGANKPPTKLQCALLDMKGVAAHMTKCVTPAKCLSHEINDEANDAEASVSAVSFPTDLLIDPNLRKYLLERLQIEDGGNSDLYNFEKLADSDNHDLQSSPEQKQVRHNEKCDYWSLNAYQVPVVRVPTVKEDNQKREHEKIIDKSGKQKVPKKNGEQSQKTSKRSSHFRKPKKDICFELPDVPEIPGQYESGSVSETDEFIRAKRIQYNQHLRRVSELNTSDLACVGGDGGACKSDEELWVADKLKDFQRQCKSLHEVYSSIIPKNSRFNCMLTSARSSRSDCRGYVTDVSSMKNMHSASARAQAQWQNGQMLSQQSGRTMTSAWHEAQTMFDKKSDLAPSVVGSKRMLRQLPANWANTDIKVLKTIDKHFLFKPCFKDDDGERQSLHSTTLFVPVIITSFIAISLDVVLLHIHQVGANCN